jgi:hypothetical protein
MLGPEGRSLGARKSLRELKQVWWSQRSLCLGLEDGRDGKGKQSAKDNDVPVCLLGTSDSEVGERTQSPVLTVCVSTSCVRLRPGLGWVYRSVPPPNPVTYLTFLGSIFPIWKMGRINAYTAVVRL